MKQKPSILIINISWITGGVEKVLCNISNELVKDYSVSIAVLFEIGNPGFYLSDEVEIFSVADKKDPEQFLIDYIKQNNIKLVLGQSGIAPPLLSWYKRMIKEDIKVVVMNHEYYFYPFDNPYYNYGIDRLNDLKDVMAVSFLTTFSEKAYRCFNDNGIIMPNMATFEPLSTEQLQQKPFGKNIAAIGRLCSPIKRIDVIIEVFAKVLQSVPEATLTLVGAENFDQKIEIKQTGKTESINEMLKKHGISERSVIKIEKTKDVKQYYETADLFLLTSESEGFPMVLLEAHAHAVPSIIARIAGLDDIIKDGENGYINDRTDVEGIAQNAVKLLTDNKTMEEFRKNSIATAEKFSHNSITERWKRLIETAINSNSEQFKQQISQFQSDMTFSKQDVIALSQEYNKICADAKNLRKNPFVKINDLFTNGMYALKTKGLKTTFKIAWSMFFKR